MDTKRGFFLLLAVTLYTCLNSCAAGPESLASGDFDKSVQAAVSVYRHQSTLVVAKNQTDLYAGLLHSDNRLVAEAAAVALSRAGDSATEALIRSLSSGDVMKSSFENGVETVLSMTNILRRDIDTAMLLCYAAESLSRTGSPLTVKYLQIALSIADRMTNETDKAIVRAAAFADKYRFGVNGALENLTNFIKTIDGMSGEYRKAEVVRAIAAKLEGLGGSDVTRIREKLAEIASRLWEQKYKARAMSALAVSAADIAPDSASRWAYAIYHGYNKEDYALVLAAAEAFAKAEETSRALDFYRIAIQMADSQRDTGAAEQASARIARSWVEMLPDQAWDRSSVWRAKIPSVTRLSGNCRSIIPTRILENRFTWRHCWSTRAIANPLWRTSIKLSPAMPFSGRRRT
jgi:hypothetical protein